MPGFKVRVPVKFLAGKSGFVVDAGLVNIDLTSQQQLNDAQDPGVSAQFSEQRVVPMNIENGSDLGALRFEENLFVVFDPGIGPQGIQFLLKTPDLIIGKKTGKKEKSVFIVIVDLRPGQRRVPGGMEVSKNHGVLSFKNFGFLTCSCS